ncbi:MAG: 3'-5' exonuclease [Bacillota bacterium]|nr:3'-5' exonuclease [Bacillota bacterium]
MRKEILPWWDELGVGNPAGFRRGLEFVLWASRLLTADLAYADADGTFYVREMIKVAAAATPQDTWESFCDRLENAILVSNHWKHSLRSGVYVLTAHQSKGREFDHVVLPWLSNAGEPIGGWRKPCWMDDEDRRLLYVALTRAKSLVTVVFPSEAPAQILCAWKLLGIPDQSEHPFR